jgi:hypothetical protein
VIFKGSRYEKVARRTYVDESGRVITYTATRLIADTPPLVGHRVVQDERLDHIAWQQYRDAQRFWRICDANLALWPDDILEQGRVIGIPPAEN